MENTDVKQQDAVERVLEAHTTATGAEIENVCVREAEVFWGAGGSTQVVRDSAILQGVIPLLRE